MEHDKFMQYGRGLGLWRNPRENIKPEPTNYFRDDPIYLTPSKGTLYTILCKLPFLRSEVTAQKITELDNKTAHCHSPVPQRHRPFLRGRLDCQPHDFFH